MNADNKNPISFAEMVEAVDDSVYQIRTRAPGPEGQGRGFTGLANI